MARTQISFIVAEVDGDIVPNATVQILDRVTGEMASVTENDDGTGVSLNPGVTDAGGRIPGWIEEGSYSVIISAPTFATYTRAHEAYDGDGVGNVGEGAVQTADIVDTAIENQHLPVGAVRGDNFVPGTLTEPKMANNSVSTRVLASNAVDTNALAANAVTNAKLATGSVGRDQVAANAVTSAELAAGAVTTAKMASTSIAAADIGTGAADADAIAPDAVGSEHIAADAVEPENLALHVMPVGFIAAFPYDLVSDYWKECNGQTLVRSSYTKLSTLIPNGAFGSDASNILLPDLRGRMIFGHAVGGYVTSATIGANEGLAVASRKPQHYHTSSGGVVSGGSHNHFMAAPSIPPATVGEWKEEVQLLWGTQTANTTGGGVHGHGLSGTTDWSGQVTNAPSYHVAKYFMKVL